jgi:hypothetical protein
MINLNESVHESPADSSKANFQNFVYIKYTARSGQYVTLYLYNWCMVFESRVLSRICVPKVKDVTVWWKKLHNEKLYNSYS